MKKFLEQAKQILNQFLVLINTEKFLVNFALLPLIWSWLPVLTFKGNLATVKKYSLISGIMTFYLFIAVVFSWIVSFIPFYGQLLANLIHFAGLLVYAGFLVYLIVTNYQGKPQNLKLIEPVYQKLTSFL